MRNTVKALREERGLTQKELATHVKCSRAYIIGIEAGKTPNIMTAFRWWLFRRLSEFGWWICPEPHKTRLTARLPTWLDLAEKESER